MTAYEKYTEMKNCLISTPFNTWFELGLYIDKIRDKRSQQKITPRYSYKEFKDEIKKGIGFISFYYAIDGVSIEISKYANAFESILGKENTNIHLIAGDFRKSFDSIMKSNWKTHKIENADGFDAWDGYNQYFFTKLSRGNSDYNDLIKKIIYQVNDLTIKIGKVIVENEIKILFPVNVSSNPGNVSLSIALMIISEFMDIPVINSNHDFYWEGGSSPFERSSSEQGVRDHFFTNSDIGEVFSPIEMLFPWDSKKWFQTTINNTQKSELISRFGFNPAYILTLPTSIDTNIYKPVTPSRREKVIDLFNNIFEYINIFNFSENHIQNWYEKQTPVILGYNETTKPNLDENTLIFLQPTRIIRRKCIQRSFELLIDLIQNTAFQKFLDENNAKITHHTTGPIALGHNDYFESVVNDFKNLYSMIPERYKNKIFISFTFGTEETKITKKKNLGLLNIEDIIASSTLVLLPSETEGRGLPIIEATASGVPIISNRYEPIDVYKEVIGDSLDPSMKLRVFEFTDSKKKDDLINQLTRVIINPEIRFDVIKHNIFVVENRFSDSVLEKVIEKSIRFLWSRLTNQSNYEIISKIISKNIALTTYDNNFKKIVLANKRTYIPGYSQIEFMIMLKSLIDPSYFRIEEKYLKGRIMDFAISLKKIYESVYKMNEEETLHFFNLIDDIFTFNKGDDSLAIDHSLSYRHRNRIHFPYRKLTEQELQGIIAEIIRSIVNKDITLEIKESTKLFSPNLENGLLEYLGDKEFEINDSSKLIEALTQKKSIGIIPSETIHEEISLFSLSYIKNLQNKEKIDYDNINFKIFVFLRDKPINSYVHYESVKNWIEKIASNEIYTLYKKGVIELVKCQHIASGFHLGQIGKDAISKLEYLKNNNGIIISFGFNSFLTLDLIDIDSFRFGCVKNKLEANFMNISLNKHFLIHVPAGLRPSLAYPTPIQTPKEFSNILKSSLYKKAALKLGETELKNLIHEDADQFGTPVNSFLKNLIESKNCRPYLHKKINGIHSDNLPWSGAIVKVDLNNQAWKFTIIEASKSGSTVLSLTDEFEKNYNQKVSFAWNGGYILNPELVGKLGISEDYIGSPLGLLIVEGKIKSLPLFNKPALAINHDGKIIIKRSNLFEGFTLTANKKDYTFTNFSSKNSSDLIFYDLMYDSYEINSTDKIIFRFVGNKLIEKISGKQSVKILPVGITLSVPEKHELNSLNEGASFDFKIPGWEDTYCAIEAGPLLVENNKIAINMEIEGWKKDKSIQTQAARLDFTDMRGPKIAAGITKTNELIIVAVNGRIRESVGATHIDIAKILIENNVETGIGFDPGGSATLVADGEQLNVSPYNKDYEFNVYSKPPEPRLVGNAVLGILTN